MLSQTRPLCSEWSFNKPVVYIWNTVLVLIAAMALTSNIHSLCYALYLAYQKTDSNRFRNNNYLCFIFDSDRTVLTELEIWHY